MTDQTPTPDRVIDWVTRIDDEIRDHMRCADRQAQADGLTPHEAFVAVSGGVMGALLDQAWRHRAPGVSIDHLADHLRAGMHEVLTIIAAGNGEEPASPDRTADHG